VRWRRPPFEHVLDVIQDGRHARAVGSSGRRDCPTVRKSVRFELTSGAIALQSAGSRLRPSRSWSPWPTRSRARIERIEAASSRRLPVPDADAFMGTDDRETFSQSLLLVGIEGSTRREIEEAVEAVRHGFAVEHDALVGEGKHRRGDGHELARPVAPIASPLAVLVGDDPLAVVLELVQPAVARPAPWRRGVAASPVGDDRWTVDCSCAVSRRSAGGIMVKRLRTGGGSASTGVDALRRRRAALSGLRSRPPTRSMATARRAWQQWPRSSAPRPV
jgi:hypothetical protein